MALPDKGKYRPKMGRIYDAFVNFFCSLSDGWMGLADRAQDRCGQEGLQEILRAAWGAL